MTDPVENMGTKKVMNTYCRGQYRASICGHWARVACQHPHTRRDPIVAYNRTNTVKKRYKSKEFFG